MARLLLVALLLLATAAPAAAQDTPPKDDKPKNGGAKPEPKNGESKPEPKPDPEPDPKLEPEKPKQPPTPFPEVSFPIYGELGRVQGGRPLLYELRYFGNGSFRIRAAGIETSSVGSVSDWSSFDDEARINDVVLKTFRARRQAIAAHIAAYIGDDDAARPAAKQALLADAAPLLVAHLLHRAAWGEQDDARKRRLNTLKLLITRREAQRYDAAVGELEALARRYLRGELTDHLLPMISRGPGQFGQARLTFLRYQGAPVAVLEHRRGSVDVHLLRDGEPTKGSFPSLRALKFRDRAFYDHWRGEREGLRSVR